MSTTELGSAVGSKPEVAADRPVPGANLSTALARYFRGYARFTGRASRSEFWWVVLVVETARLGTAIAVESLLAASARAVDAQQYLTSLTLASVLALLLAVGILALVVPTLALFWRRLHDADHPGPIALLTLVPLLGGFVVIFIGLRRSSPAGRRFDSTAIA